MSLQAFAVVAVPPQLILAHSSDIVKKNTYHEVVSYTGHVWSLISAVCIILMGFGTNTTYLVIVGNQGENSMFRSPQTINNEVKLVLIVT